MRRFGPLAGAVALAMLAGTAVYAFAEDAACESGKVMRLRVAAAPEIVPAVAKAARRFNDEHDKVGDACVQAEVAAADVAATSTMLSGHGVPSDTARVPDVWIPDSSLWVSAVRASGKQGRNALAEVRPSIAASPVVIGIPQGRGALAPSWAALLKALGNTPTGPGAARLLVPDPAASATGMASFMITDALLGGRPDKPLVLTALARTIRETTLRTPEDQFARFTAGTGRRPVALVSEQALWKHNRDGRRGQAVAVYPQEGTLSLDYPYVVTARDRDRARAAGLLAAALRDGDARRDVQDLGFRTPDGQAPASFTEAVGVRPEAPRSLPAPGDAAVGALVQAWLKLSLGMRLLILTDVSGSMAEQVSPGLTRIQAVARTFPSGLSMMSDDTEVGTWLFATDLDGAKPYRELASVGPLGERVGSRTRRDTLLAALPRLKAEPGGGTGLYETVLAAYKYMSRTYKPEFGHSITVLTDGRNDQPGSDLTLAETLRRLRAMQEPDKLIVVNMIGYGDDVSRTELEQIARVTRGAVQVAESPGDIRKIFLKLLSRRITEH
ncbi:substrate-binding domain-containing protein [Actinomadura macrotermitis]|uniref:VWFA domain-containing protein n=1 Tax=Actinomadura macrotermitis TaxID=2585200 RepID=A0A7K0BXF7_9ACTN|nr:substrate-binding domain-containing protein [Actinomadura macrotermitis]MQY05870.1 hypothetical protein [Actinomadura macrotermitis]